MPVISEIKLYLRAKLEPILAAYFCHLDSQTILSVASQLVSNGNRM
jgi:hypothetical protein